MGSLLKRFGSRGGQLESSTDVRQVWLRPLQLLVLYSLIANSETDVTHDVSVVKSGRGAEFNSGTIELRVWDASMGVFVFSIRVDVELFRLGQGRGHRTSRLKSLNMSRDTIQVVQATEQDIVRRMWIGV